MRSPRNTRVLPGEAFVHAAALVARDPQMGVSMMLPWSEEAVNAAHLAAERVGVDVQIEARGRLLALRFVARHTDLRIDVPTSHMAVLTTPCPEQRARSS